MFAVKREISPVAESIFNSAGVSREIPGAYRILEIEYILAPQ